MLSEQRKQNRSLTLRSNLLVEQLDDQVAPNEERVYFRRSQAFPHRFGNCRTGQLTHAVQKAAVDGVEILGLQELFAEPKRTRVVDHPHLPVFGPEDVA